MNGGLLWGSKWRFSSEDLDMLSFCSLKYSIAHPLENIIVSTGLVDISL